MTISPTADAVRSYDRIYLAGEWTRPVSRRVIEVTDPHTERVVATVPDAGPADIVRAVAAARDAFDHGPWPRMAPADRGAHLGRLADLFEDHLEHTAQVITTEMGSPIGFSRAHQVPEPVRILRYYTSLAKSFPFTEHRDGLDGPVLIDREPAGVVAAICPWNVPLWSITTKLAPALAAGCTLIVKPAPETPLDALLLAELADQAGIPPGVVNVLPATTTGSARLVRHAGVDKVAFTGSVRTGRIIAARCGRRIARCTLELGGKSAAIICQDADLEHTITELRRACFLNSGQACAAQTRVLVPASRHDEVVDALADLTRSLVVGDPADPRTEIGPMASRRHHTSVESHIRSAVASGAVEAAGGQTRYPQGFYIQPTLLTDVDPTMRIWREEVFGPVVTVTPYTGEDEAVALANDTPYGLSGSVWTRDRHRGLAIARRIRTGNIGINDWRLDPAAPFGGFKTSGIGRELGPEGLLSFTEPKAIPYRA